MSYTEVTSQGWFSRLMSSITGVLVGLVMIAISFVLLFWNEGRSVHRAQTLAEGKTGCISISADKVEAANDGKLVHVSGEAKTAESLKDTDLGVQADPGALVLSRKVEMYQWDEDKKTEKHKKLGGGEETRTTYTYDKEWADHAIDSSSFKEKGHDNPAQMPFSAAQEVAQNATLGAFKLPADMLGRLTNGDKLAVKTAAKGLKLNDGGLYKGSNPASPAIGDVRITFTEVKSGPYSLVGQQKGDSFQAYTAKSGDTIVRLEPGNKSKDEMFGEMAAENNMMTWILRAVGFVLMWIGIGAVFNPFAVFLDVIPLLGDLMGLGIGLFAFFLAAILSLITIAIGWIAYRPLLGILLLGGAIGLIVMGVKAGHARRG